MPSTYVGNVPSVWAAGKFNAVMAPVLVAMDAASVESSVSRLLMSVSAVVSRPSLSAMDRLAVAISVWSSLMLVALVAVSYTHLTLPTIYSV